MPGYKPLEKLITFVVYFSLMAQITELIARNIKRMKDNLQSLIAQ